MRLGDGGMYLRTAPITKVSKEIEEVKKIITDEIEVEVPDGINKYKILDIKKSV